MLGAVIYSTTILGIKCRVKNRLHILFIDAQDTPTPSKSLIEAATVYFLDSQLSQCRGTHDTRFDCHIKCNVVERTCGWRKGDYVGGGQHVIYRFELRVPGRLLGDLD